MEVGGELGLVRYMETSCVRILGSAMTGRPRAAEAAGMDPHWRWSDAAAASASACGWGAEKMRWGWKRICVDAAVGVGDVEGTVVGVGDDEGAVVGVGDDEGAGLGCRVRVRG